jgi:hypothetical protein
MTNCEWYVMCEEIIYMAMKKNKTGLKQGASLSPILFNLALQR